MNTVSAPRPAGSLNRVYWYFEQMVNANSCEWIEIDGRLDIDMLQDAARIVASRHPVLNSRLRVGPLWRLDWVEDVGNLPIDIRVERLSVRTPAEIHDRLVANVWGERLPLRTGRPFRLHVTELEAMTVLQVITTHVFTDGHSANLVVRDLVRAYRSLHTGQPWVPVRFDVENRDMVNLFAAHLPIRERIRLTFKALCAIMREALSHAGRLGESSQPRTMTDVVMLDLGPQVFANVRRASATMGNSRHPLYVAAALRAIEDFNMKRGIQPCGRVFKIIDNFSLRRFASQDLTDLYDLCSLPYSLKANGAFDDETLIRNVSAQIEELRSGEILAEVFRQIIYKASTIFLPKVIATRLVLASIVKTNFILSNIGPVPEEIERFGNSPIISYYSFPQLFSPGQVMFLFSTQGATLRLICLFDPGNFARGDVVEELVGGFTRHLDRICHRFGRNAAVQARQGRELSKTIQTEQAMPRVAEVAHGRDG